MRLAQRAHRLRKETKIADLEDQVERLNKIVDNYRTCFQGLQETMLQCAVTNPALVCHVGSIADCLQKSTSSTVDHGLSGANTESSVCDSLPLVAELDRKLDTTVDTRGTGYFGFQLFDYSVNLAYGIACKDDALSVRLTARLFGHNLEKRRKLHEDTSILSLRRRLGRLLIRIEHDRETVRESKSWAGYGEVKWPGTNNAKYRILLSTKLIISSEFSHWLNPIEVETYLRHRGVEFDPEGSFIRIYTYTPQRDITLRRNMCELDNQETERDGPLSKDSTFYPSPTESESLEDDECEERLAQSSLTDLFPDYCDAHIDPFDRSFAMSETKAREESHREVQQAVDIASDGEIPTSQMTFGYFPGFAALPERSGTQQRSSSVHASSSGPGAFIHVDVGDFLARLASVGICIGQGPGFLKEDVEAAIRLSIAR